jgi:ribosome-binding protein aMBF1 (putative translation factor)
MSRTILFYKQRMGSVLSRISSMTCRARLPRRWCGFSLYGRSLSARLSKAAREKAMSDLKKYITKRKKTDKNFAAGFEEGYEQFKIGVVLRQARESAGLTQEELAARLKTKKTAISRIENHAEDIKLSTLDRVAKALGKRLEVHIA